MRLNTPATRFLLYWTNYVTMCSKFAELEFRKLSAQLCKSVVPPDRYIRASSYGFLCQISVEPKQYTILDGLFKVYNYDIDL